MATPTPTPKPLKPQLQQSWGTENKWISFPANLYQSKKIARRKCQRRKLWKLLNLSSLKTYLLAARRRAVKAATNYNKIVISFNLSAAQRAKFLFMFCHLVVRRAGLSSRCGSVASAIAIFCAFPFPLPMPMRSRLEQCQRNMHLTLMAATGPKRAERNGYIYRVVQPVSCNWIAAPVWLATVGIDHISVPVPVPVPLPGAAEAKVQTATASWQMNYVSKEVQQVMNSLFSCHVPLGPQT